MSSDLRPIPDIPSNQSVPHHVGVYDVNVPCCRVREEWVGVEFRRLLVEISLLLGRAGAVI